MKLEGADGWQDSDRVEMTGRTHDMARSPAWRLELAVVVEGVGWFTADKPRLKSMRRRTTPHEICPSLLKF
jgi:hypothetical protein